MKMSIFLKNIMGNLFKIHLHVILPSALSVSRYNSISSNNLVLFLYSTTG
jgi:uncharacterized membrane protein